MGPESVRALILAASVSKVCKRFRHIPRDLENNSGASEETAKSQKGTRIVLALPFLLKENPRGTPVNNMKIPHKSPES